MKFNCENCNRRMKSDGSAGAGGGAMSVSAFCPNCGNRFSLWANPGETLLLKALNAGLAGGELMTQVLESAGATLPHAIDQAPLSQSVPPADWTDLADHWLWVEPGSFVMGSPGSEAGRETDESPQHEVTISGGFHLGKYTVTRGQWERVMGTSPWEGESSIPSSPVFPAVFISWNDVQQLISRLNSSNGYWRYRLPTEAEWEYACRAGTSTMWSFGEGPPCPRRLRLVHRQRGGGQRPDTPGGGGEAAQPLGTARYARERLGVVPGRVRGRLLPQVARRRSSRAQH